MDENTKPTWHTVSLRCRCGKVIRFQTFLRSNTKEYIVCQSCLREYAVGTDDGDNWWLSLEGGHKTAISNNP